MVIVGFLSAKIQAYANHFAGQSSLVGIITRFRQAVNCIRKLFSGLLLSLSLAVLLPLL